ncbi:MAG: flagellar hook-basal body complex protein FliE [Paracoccaceae bacterium]|nr:flagellar hook-basal body complex protein FliE [Paracoccaceae bacterium]
MDVRLTQALKSYGATKTDIKPEATDGLNAFSGAAQDFADTLAKTEQIAEQAMVGKADPHALVEALANTQLAVETAVTVRDRVVEAYQEILRMPV